MDDIYQQILKEWYWLVIYAAIVSLAFVPSFLKGKCPKCKKRKLTSVDIDDQLRQQVSEGITSEFLTFYRCEACGARLYRERSGPLADASDAKWDLAFSR